MIEYKVDESYANQRLDKYIAYFEKEMTRSYIKTLVDGGNVLVNGKVQKAGYIVKANDNILIDKPEDEMADIQAENIALNIIYEDDDVIIIDKPKGMVVHPANGNYTGTMVNSLMYSHSDKLSSINGIVRPGIVHRIDKDTSGILVVAKNDKSHKKLAGQFKVHSIKRKYIAIVKGIVKHDEFSVNLPIGRSNKDRKKMAVVSSGRQAITHILVVKRFYESNLTLVEATLETGRTHQIRVHLSYMGYPLLGDEVYGKKDTKYKLQGQMLHAKTLGIIHPATDKYMEFESNLPKEFSELLQKLEIKEKASNA